MINVLLPAMGKSTFFKDYYFPKLMLEVNGETVLERVVANFSSIKDKHFIFVLSEKECMNFHIDQSARIITERNSDIVVLKNQTQGALCTCLICLEYIDNDDPLIIANFDQIIDIDYEEVIRRFEESNLDGGVITFPSIHPRWSYVRLEGKNVIEVAEKRPISQHAIAGFYYYKHGRDFVEGAKNTILKNNTLDNKYYISSSINEMILNNKKIGIYEVGKEQYHSFYSPEKIQEYERKTKDVQGGS